MLGTRKLPAAVLAFSMSLFAQSDFRKANWGMTQDQVMAAESKPPVNVSIVAGVTTLRYDSIKFAGVPAGVLYFLEKGKLTRAKYLFDSPHKDLNEFIADYNKLVEPELREHFGKPASERAVWDNPVYQDESKEYLERDRSTPSEIFVSDRFAGAEISLGHLKLYTQWTLARSTVLHALTGENQRMIHQIEFRPKEGGL
jgi:hypothetical protein